MKHKQHSTFLLAVCLSVSIVTQSVHAAKGGNGKPGGGGGGGSDTTPPAQITDLVAFNDVNSGHFITLRWTTVGDDGNAGNAAAYELRYSTLPAGDFPDVDTWWNQAETYSQPPRDPDISLYVAGSTQLGSIRFLDPNQTYYVALKVFDEAGNGSGVSNVASSSTGDQQWIFEEIFSGRFLKHDVAVDPIDGNVSISYNDHDGDAHLFLHDSPTGWSESVIDGPNVPSERKIAFDLSTDRLPAVGFRDLYDGLRYAAWDADSGAWNIESIEIGETGAFGFAFDPVDGQPSFSTYISTGKGRKEVYSLAIVHRTSEGWVTEQVADTFLGDKALSGRDSALAFGSDFTSWVVYTDALANGQTGLHVASRDPESGHWSLSTVIAEDAIREFDLTIDPVSNSPLIVFASTQNEAEREAFSIYCASINQGQWQAELVASQPWPGLLNQPSISANQQGDIFVSYDRWNVDFEWGLVGISMASKVAGGSWDSVDVDRGLTAESSISSSPISGKPFISYVDEGIVGDQLFTLYLARPFQP